MAYFTPSLRQVHRRTHIRFVAVVWKASFWLYLARRSVKVKPAHLNLFCAPVCAYDFLWLVTSLLKFVRFFARVLQFVQSRLLSSGFFLFNLNCYSHCYRQVFACKLNFHRKSYGENYCEFFFFFKSFIVKKFVKKVCEKVGVIPNADPMSVKQMRF